MPSISLKRRKKILSAILRLENLFIFSYWQCFLIRQRRRLIERNESNFYPWILSKSFSKSGHFLICFFKSMLGFNNIALTEDEWKCQNKIVACESLGNKWIFSFFLFAGCFSWKMLNCLIFVLMSGCLSNKMIWSAVLFPLNASGSFKDNSI